MRTAVILLSLAAGAARAAGPAADPLDRALADVAKAVVAHAADARLGSVGVIAVDVVYAGDRPAGAGELNAALARRLEVAVLLTAHPDADLVVLCRPWQALADAHDKVATHRTAAGRRKFFLHKYTPAWTDAGTAVEAGGLVVLTAKVGAKLDAVGLSAEVFDKSGDRRPVAGGTATAALSRRTLAELGCGFRADPGGRRLAVAGARGMDPQIMANNLPAQTADAPADEPISLPTPARPGDLLRDAPVKLRVRYDGADVPVEPAADGTFRVRPPRAGEEVSFVLTNATADPLAAVLKVNGENTIERQTLPDDRCRKWVLDPGKPVAVRGYLRADNATWDGFKVLTDAESAAEGERYGPHAGTFRLSVFAGRREPGPAPPDPPVDEPSSIFLAVARGASEAGDRPQSLATLQQQLRKRPPELTGRGLVVAGGGTAQQAVDTVRFELSSPAPFYNLPVCYDAPADRPKAD